MDTLRALWDYNDPAGSEARFDQYLGQELDQEARAEALTQKARAQGLQRRFEDARSTLALAQSLISDRPTSAHAAYWLELGRVENSSQNREAAKPHFLRALELAEAGGHEFLAVDAAHMMGIAAGGENALEWNLRAIEMADHASDPLARNWLGSLLNNTGWSLYDLHRYEEALAMFERAQAFREEQLEAGRGSVDNVRIARYCVAKGLRALGRLHEALERQAALAKELLEAGKQPGYQWEEMGEALLSLGRKDEAKPYFAQAYGVLSQDPWLAANEGSRLKRLAELGSVVIEPMEG